MAPPSAGATLRVMLKPTELSETAPATSCLGTMSPTEACQAGLFERRTQPIRKVKASSVHA